jgi:hypothetical protein
MTNTPRPTSRLPRILLAAYLITCLLALIWPGYPLFGAKVEPRLLGLPFAFIWTIGWVVATFVVLVLFHRSVERED